jgi:hypothetical protein
MPSAYTPVVLLALGGVLIGIGAWIGPETKDVDFVADVRPAEPERAGTGRNIPARAGVAPGPNA